MGLRLGNVAVDMDPVENGWFEATIENLSPGQLYGFSLGDGLVVPDPASRKQAGQVEGPSVLIDPTSYRWTNVNWTGRPWAETIIYEIHIGTFTEQGTFRAAADRLEDLAKLGVTAIELMPVAHFPGRRGWGYDGVLQYAPHQSYGEPDDLKAFIDAAHGHGLMVFLDVVYNHFGPQGNFLPQYAPQFFHEDQPTPWGSRIAFEVEPVRRFFLDNVRYWLDEFRFDGLRFDAIDQIDDTSDRHILTEISDVVHAYAKATARHIHLVTENPANVAELIVDRADGTRLYTADWNDDFHHVVHVIATGEDKGHYAPFRDRAWEKLHTTLATGYIEQGDPVLSERRTPSQAVSPTAFVHFLQNHDQVGNRALGNRLNTMVDRRSLALLTEILLLSPQIPLLFMGDDHLSPKPFRFFADYEGDIARLIKEGRSGEAANFGGIPEGFAAEDIPDPVARATFEESRIDWNDASGDEAREWRRWLSNLIHFRLSELVPFIDQMRGCAGSIVKAPAECVFVDWTSARGVIRLRANLSSADVICDRPVTEQIYPREHRADGILPSRTVSLFLALD
jgi:malto-oligosyltrehalose trehalohydrolase